MVFRWLCIAVECSRNHLTTSSQVACSQSVRDRWSLAKILLLCSSVFEIIWWISDWSPDSIFLHRMLTLFPQNSSPCSGIPVVVVGVWPASQGGFDDNHSWVYVYLLLLGGHLPRHFSFWYILISSALSKTPRVHLGALFSGSNWRRLLEFHSRNIQWPNPPQSQL